MKKQALTIFSLVLACALSSGNVYCSEQKTKEQIYYTTKCICNPGYHTEQANTLCTFVYSLATATNRGGSWEVHPDLNNKYMKLKRETPEKCMATIEHIVKQWLSMDDNNDFAPYHYATQQVIQEIIDQREQENKDQEAKKNVAEQISVSSRPTTILQEKANLRNCANENNGGNKDGYTVLYRSKHHSD